MWQEAGLVSPKNSPQQKGHHAMTKILRFLLCLEKTVIEGARIREKGIAVAVKPRKREMRRCPECGRGCPVEFHRRSVLFRKPVRFRRPALFRRWALSRGWALLRRPALSHGPALFHLACAMVLPASPLR